MLKYIASVVAILIAYCFVMQAIQICSFNVHYRRNLTWRLQSVQTFLSTRWITWWVVLCYIIFFWKIIEKVWNMT